MNKELQKEILEYIKKLNDSSGSSYNLAWENLIDFFKSKYTVAEIVNNFKYLEDEKKIEKPYEGSGAVRITAIGLLEFDQWYKKLWRFFTNDIAKILSIIATAVSIAVAIFK